MKLERIRGDGARQRVRRADLRLPALFGVVAVGEALVQGYRPLWVALGTYGVALLVLSARRAFPLATPLVVAAIYALTPVLGFDVSQPAAWILPPALACFGAGLHVPRSRAAAGLASVLGTLAIVFAGLGWLTDFSPDILFGLLFTLGPWGLGVALRESFDRNRELAVEAERTRAEAEAASAAAAAAERERIARELHDVLAHSLSVMVVQAALAEDLVAKDPAAAAEAMRNVQDSGRDALGETGRLLRLIRDAENELGLRPQRALEDLPALAEDFSRAGLDVELAVDPAARTVPVGVGLSAYRIVQEGLTNALKHAPGSRVTVRLARRAEDVSIEIENGPGTGASAADVTGGHGLVGVRERVGLFGGTLHAKRTESGGFRLLATLPAPPEAR